MIPDLPGMPSMEDIAPGTTHGFMSMSIPISVPMPGQPAPQARSNDMPASGPVQMQTGNSPVPQPGPQRPGDNSGGQPAVPVNIQPGVPNVAGIRRPGPQARAVFMGAQRRQPQQNAARPNAAQPNAARPAPRRPGPIGGEDLLRVLPPDISNAIRAIVDRLRVQGALGRTVGTAGGEHFGAKLSLYSIQYNSFLAI